MKKGFTLVELLGVIIIIGIIALITTTISNRIVSDSRVSIYENHEKTMERAARNYALTEDIVLPDEETDVVTIDLEILIDYGYISEIKDSRNDNMPCTGHVDVLYEEGIIKYEPFLNCGASYQTP